MLDIADCLKLPGHEKSMEKDKFPLRLDMRVHKDWLSEEYEVLDKPLAGMGCSQLFIQFVDVEIDTYSRIKLCNNNGKTLTIKDFLMGLTYYMHLDTERWPIENSQISIQNEVANQDTNMQVNAFFDQSTLPYHDPKPPPRNYLDAISSVDVSPYLKSYSGLPKKSLGKRAHSALFDGKTVVHGLEASANRGDMLLLHMRHPEPQKEQTNQLTSQRPKLSAPSKKMRLEYVLPPMIDGDATDEFKDNSAAALSCHRHFL